MTVNFQTDKLIIMKYPPYAGGKFISNCLALSKHAVVQNEFIADLDYRFTENFEIENLVWQAEFERLYDFLSEYGWEEYCKRNGRNPPIFPSEFITTQIKMKLEYMLSCAPFKDYKDFKYKSVISTLPNHSKMKDWMYYEFGCHQFFGNMFMFDMTDCPPNILHTASNGNKNFFIVAHTHELANAYKGIWPNAKTVELVNYKNFQTLSISLKENHDRPKTIGLDLGHSVDATFDVDGSLSNATAFLSAMESLYDTFGYDDFDPKLVKNFYNSYIKLHKED